MAMDSLSLGHYCEEIKSNGNPILIEFDYCGDNFFNNSGFHPGSDFTFVNRGQEGVFSIYVQLSFCFNIRQKLVDFYSSLELYIGKNLVATCDKSHTLAENDHKHSMSQLCYIGHGEELNVFLKVESRYKTKIRIKTEGPQNSYIHLHKI